MTTTIPIPLHTIEPRQTSRPKGLAPYRPKNKTQRTVERVLDLYARLEAADALPAGPRTVGYRLKETYVGEYTKKDFPAINDIIVRLQQAGRLPWHFVSDASSVTRTVDGWITPAGFLTDVHGMYHRDRREGQRRVVEIHTESRETLGLISRLGGERGVGVYSGGGCCGPNLAHKVARRALDRAIKHGQDTILLGVSDFDQAGIRNVMRPHVEHVAAFLYGTSGNQQVIASEDADGQLVSLVDTGATVSFDHLALTPQMARELVETDEDRDLIDAYIASGDNVWTRDLAWLGNVQKVETEVLDPVALRDLVVQAIDSTIDTAALRLVVDEEREQRADLEHRLGGIASEIGGAA